MAGTFVVDVTSFVMVPYWVMDHEIMQGNSTRMMTYVGLRRVAWEQSQRPWKSDRELASAVAGVTGIGSEAVRKNLREILDSGIIYRRDDRLVVADKPTESGYATGADSHQSGADSHQSGGAYLSTMRFKIGDTTTAAAVPIPTSVSDSGLDHFVLGELCSSVDRIFESRGCDGAKGAPSVEFHPGPEVIALVRPNGRVIFVDPSSGERYEGTSLRKFSKFPGECVLCSRDVPAYSGVLKGRRPVCGTVSGWFAVQDSSGTWRLQWGS